MSSISRPIVMLGLLSFPLALGWPWVFPLESLGEDWIRTTIWLALLHYFLALFLLLRDGKRSATARWTWSLGCLAFVIHVAMAFHFHHHWSHAHAVAHVEAESGFGPGIFISYFFTLLWTVDALWWWISWESYVHRSRWTDGLIYGFMLFIIFNGSVIFEGGPIRWASLIGYLFILSYSILRIRKNMLPSHEASR